MRALKIAAVVVALLFIFTIFQNSYSMAIAQAKEEESETESALPEVKNDEQSFSSEPISSVPGPPASAPASISDPALAPDAIPASTPISVPASAPTSTSTSISSPISALTPTPTSAPVSTPTPTSLSASTLASAPVSTSAPDSASVSALGAPEALKALEVLKERSIIEPREQQYPYTTAVQNIIDDFRGRGTLTEFLFAFLKNLWAIIRNLPEIFRIISTFNTETYAGLIKWFGGFLLGWPSHIRALPGKMLTNFVATINALPAWLRESPTILHAFPLLVFSPILPCCIPCLFLPIGPQFVAPLLYVLRFLLSLAENAIAIPLGLLLLPLSAVISVFRGLPGSLRAVVYHVLDFALTPLIFFVRVLPLFAFSIALIGLWFAGVIFAFIFSPFLMLAFVVLIIAIFVNGISDEGIKSAIASLPEGVGNISSVLERIFVSVGSLPTKSIAPSLDSLLGIEWLTVTKELATVLPEALRSIGSAIPDLVLHAPDLMRTLINSGLTFTIQIAWIDQWVLAWARNFIDLITRLPQLALLVPSSLEILSVISVHFPELIASYIPSAFSAFDELVKNLPNFSVHIVLTTMGCNVIVLEFARSVWRLGMRWAEVIIQILWGLILVGPIIPLDADVFVTPWFGPRFFSLILFVPILFIVMTLILIVVIPMLIVGAVIGGILLVAYLLLMVVVMILTFILSILEALSSLLGIINLVITVIGGVGIDIGFISDIIGAISTLLSVAGMFAGFILPLFMFIPVIFVLLLLAFLGFIILSAGVTYFVLYIVMIAIGVLIMIISYPLQAIFTVLLAIFGKVPIIGTLLGLCNTFTSFYAFCIPPNFIEVITQLLPLCVNVLASAPSVIFMPISLAKTVMEEVSSLIYALPSIPGYVMRLGSRVVFSLIAELIAVVSLIIDIIVAIMLVIFALITSLLFECLTLDILKSMPQILVLSLALGCVSVASMLDICGVLVLRLPDMISEYAYSVLKSVAMIPVLSAIVPSIPATPAMLQPEVVIEGLSMISMGILLLPLAIPGALMVLVYNIIVWVLRTIHSISPRIVTLPIDLTRRCLSIPNNICSGIASVLEGSTKRMEASVVPY